MHYYNSIYVMLRILNTFSPFLCGKPELLSILLQVMSRAKAGFRFKNSFELGISGLSLFTLNSHVNSLAPIIHMLRRHASACSRCLAIKMSRSVLYKLPLHFDL